MNEVNRETIVSKLGDISGLQGIVVCEEGEQGRESLVLLYHVFEERFFQELQQAIHHLDDAGIPLDYRLREFGNVGQAITDCLEGKITVRDENGYPFGIVNSAPAAEIHHGKILWEASDHPLTSLKEKLVMQGSYPEKLRQTAIASFMKAASLLLENGHGAAMQGDIHYASGSFSQAVSSWVQVIYALNGQFLLSEHGNVKRASQLMISPKQFRLRVNQIYRYFAANNPKLAYCEIDMLEQEMAALVQTFEEESRQSS